MTRVRERLAKATGGAATAPVLVLAGLNLVDEFDRSAFYALTPEIRDAFALSDTGIGAIGVVAGAFIVATALPMGLLADRFHRVRLSAAAALLWSTMSIATGLAPALWALVVVRLLAGAGRTANEVLHPSLLSDYYAPRALPQVFKIHRLANPLGITSAILAGFIGATLGWRWAFFLLAIPTFPLLLGLLRLHEPERGATIDPQHAAEAASTGTIPFAEARRRLYAIRSLKRTWITSFLIGTGAIAIGQLLVLFFEQVHRFGPTARGLVTFLWGAGTVAGLFVGGALASRAVGDDDEPTLALINARSGFTFAGALWLTAISPWPLLSLAGAFGVGVGTGLFQPAYYALVGRIAPARIRSQAYAWAIIHVATGALVGIVFFEVGDTQGYRLSLSLLAAVVLVAGFVARSAAAFVRRDVEQADMSLATAAELRRQLEETGGRALLACRSVEVAYGPVQVLFGVDLEVRPGEIVALLGTNGAGKSTLLKAISGLVEPLGGAIFFAARDITHADANQTAALGIAHVPGGTAIFPTLTVTEHLRLAAWLEKDAAHVRQATDEVFALFGVLDDRREQLAGNLSGGEQQMLGLAMAFITKPRLLVIDELSLGLAPTIVGDLLDAVRRLQDRGCAVLLVEQSVNVALTLAERAYFLEKGEVRFEGPTAALLERDDILRSVFLQGAAGGLADGDAPATAADAVGPTGNGQTDLAAHEDTVEIAPVPVAPAVLEVRGLSKSFGGITAIRDTTLQLKANEILGLIGPNGAGKTTLFDLICGFLAPDAGTIWLGGTEITTMTPSRRAWLGLGRSFQDARLVPSLSVAENLALGLDRHLDHHDHLAALLRLPGIVNLEQDVAWTVEDLVELLGLGAYRDKLVRELSTGTRRVVDLAMMIGHDPEVLLLDEPSSGIAQRETEALEPLLRRIKVETGCAMLVIEHDMPLITSLSDRMIAMDLGHPIAQGAPAEVTSHEDVVTSYLGGDLSVIRRSGTVARP
jgi:branched-chain amino acid transport system ATP-binding protein